MQCIQIQRSGALIDANRCGHIPATSAPHQLSARRSAAGLVMPNAQACPVSARPTASAMVAGSSCFSYGGRPINTSCPCRP